MKTLQNKKKYSVLFEMNIKAKNKDELDKIAETISNKATKILKQEVKPYGYYEF